MYTHLPHSLTHPKPHQEQLCRMEEQTRCHKEAFSKGPRDGKRPYLMSIYCDNGVQGFSSHSHLLTPHIKP